MILLELLQLLYVPVVGGHKRSRWMLEFTNDFDVLVRNIYTIQME